MALVRPADLSTALLVITGPKSDPYPVAAQSVGGWTTWPGIQGASFLVFKARMSTDEDVALFSVKPEKTRFGLAPFDKLIVGVPEPDDDEGNSFEQINVDFILVAPFGKFNPNCY